ncbi:MAG: potassium channel protein [Pseudomonadota bacterium]
MARITQAMFLARAVLSELWRRLRLPVTLLAAIFVGGTGIYWLLGGGNWSLLDCAYMTSITLTTVGYGEILDPTPEMRFFTMLLMWSGMGVALYAISTITAFVVEEHLSLFLKERRMEAMIKAMNGHFIVCGAGRVGRHAIAEIAANQHPVVVIEDRAEGVDWLKQNFPQVPVLQGDATDEEMLQRAGIERAAGLAAVLPDDSQNMLITVQARFINGRVRIGARCSTRNLVEKFYRAGATYVVNTDFIGGMRLASEMIRPQVVNFLDRMLRGKDPTVRVAEVTVEPGAVVAGQALGESGISARTGLRPVALKLPAEADFIYNPGPDQRLEPGMVVIVIGNPGQIKALQDLCRA